ncbi:unnamed protein product [Closterium sp. Yama58-4]|nr:unnamed protein product [Closterium sp. Yama58-4]
MRRKNPSFLSQLPFAHTSDGTFHVWETESWTCQQWSVGAQQITAAAWSPDSRVLLLAFQSTPTLAAVHIARSPPALDIHVLPLELPELAALMIDPMVPPELSTFGGVQDMAWDPTGRRLALSFSSARMDTAGLVALFDTHLAPILTATLLGATSCTSCHVVPSKLQARSLSVCSVVLWVLPDIPAALHRLLSASLNETRGFNNWRSLSATWRAAGSLVAAMGAGLVSETLHAPAFLAGWRRWRISRWGKSAVVDPCLAIFRRGADPKQLAFSLSLGFVTGLFPLCGLTAALCAVVAYVLRTRSHGPTMMFATFLATPVEVSLIIPYMRLGECLARSDHLAISPTALIAALSFSHSGSKASARLLLGLVHAVLAWLVTAPLLVWLFYRLLLPLAVRFTRRAPLSHVTTGIVIGSSSMLVVCMLLVAVQAASHIPHTRTLCTRM